MRILHILHKFQAISFGILHIWVGVLLKCVELILKLHGEFIVNIIAEHWRA